MTDNDRAQNDRAPDDHDDLLAYLYDALPDAERRVMDERLASDPELRESLARARTEQETLARAASVSGKPVDLVPPRSRLFTMRGMGIAAAALLALGAGFFGWRASQRTDIARRHPVLTATGPGVLNRGSKAVFDVTFASADGKPVKGDVKAVLRTHDGKEHGTWDVTTDADGRARVEIEPPVLGAGKLATMRFEARTGDGAAVSRGLQVRDGTRVVTRVSTDKPLYKPGEKVRIRGVGLEAFRLTVAEDVPLRMTMTDPRGGTVFDHRLVSVKGNIAWEHDLSADAVGGAYTVTLGSWEAKDGGETGLVAPTERTFHVQSYRVPRLRFDLELDRDSYGPGDDGTAQMSVERAEGGAPVGATATAELRVDGHVVSTETTVVGEDGTLLVPFALPADMAEGRGSLSVTVEDGGVVETTSRTVPIALGRLDVELYPEGGELVAGLPTRVYFRSRTPLGEPADLEFELRDGDDLVATAEVDVRGMGRFELTPRAGGEYTLHATEPFDVDLAYEFPDVIASGGVLTAKDEFVASKAPLSVRVVSTATGTHGLDAWCRGGRLGASTVELRAGEAQDVEIPTLSEVGGVVRITLTAPDGLPLAERLVSRDPARELRIVTQAERDRYAPRENVDVTVQVTDRSGAPVVGAVLGATVVDEAVLSLANDEDTAPLPLHFLLGMEVEELEKVEVFVAGEESRRAVDLLLGVQGWRRFAWRDVDGFMAKHPEKGARVVAVPASRQTVASSNKSSAENAVRGEMRRFDDKAKGVAVAGGVIAIVLGGIVLTIRSLWQRRPFWAIAGVIPALLLATLIVMVKSGRGDMVEAMAPGMAVEMAAAGDAIGIGGGGGGAWGADRDVRRRAVRHDLGAPVPEEQLGGARAFDNPATGADDKAKRVADAAMLGFLKAAADEKAMDGRLAKEVMDMLEDMDADDFEMEEIAALTTARQVLLREYAHKAAEPSGVRDDFTEVLYWNALLLADEKGQASFSFDTSDSITSFRVAVDGHDGRGALGATHVLIENRVPFYVEPKLPVELSAGDEPLLPLAVANDTAAAAGFTVDVASGSPLLEIVGDTSFAARAGASARTRVLVPFVVRQGRGTAALTIDASSGSGHTDRSRREIPVVPRGYPRTVSRSGLVEKVDGTEFMLPADLDVRTVTGDLKLYPSTLSSLVDGLDGLLREPHGCFEQASSANYPNVLVLSYLEEQQQAAPAIASRARDLLARGYAKLAGYECKELGYEWFGGDPGHEALTAYGLMEFVDMAAVHDVDAEMVERTRSWLLDRRDGDGGFRRNARALDSFGAAPDDVTNAYITWALTEAGEAAEIDTELGALLANAKSSDDAYVIALAANAAINARHADAAGLVTRLAGMQKDDGSLEGATKSITSSTGRNLTIETTSLASLAFSRTPKYLADAEEAIGWILEQRQNGRFGATQATIMALRALIAHARAARTTETAHDIVVKVNGNVVAEQHVPAGAAGAILFDREVIDALVPGENAIEVTTTGDEALPWGLSLSYATLQPASSPDCAVRIETSLDTETATEGEAVGLKVRLVNTTDEGQPMTLVRVGLPAGLEVSNAKLDELKKAGRIDFWETRPREITLYYRALAPNAEKTLDLELTAAIPGRYEGPASSAYLYYTDEHKDWAAPMALVVQPR